MTLQNGDLLNNRYLIKQVVAARGDTVIYRAFDQITRSEVGIRECRASSPEAWQKIHRENGIFASLRHPNLMRITDSFEDAGRAVYQVTDFVDGKKVLDPARNPEGIPAREAAPVILAVCDAIYTLHTNHPPVIHSEVNLDTINLSPDGQVILILPGWILEGSLGGSRTNINSHSSAANPQQDIADLGLVLAQMLTGQLARESSVDISPTWLPQVLNKANPPMSEGIAMVLKKALNPDQSQRFQHIEEFKSALLNAVIFMPSEPVTHPTPANLPKMNAKSPGEQESEISGSIEPAIQPEPPSLPKTPIRRRVPWGLLILGFSLGAAVLAYLAGRV